VVYISILLLELISIDGHSFDVIMLNKNLGKLTVLGFIECTVRVNAFVTILEQCMSKDIVRLIVLMVPNQGNGLTVILFKCISSNGSAICT
jgi:hypothetical protein